MEIHPFKVNDTGLVLDVPTSKCLAVDDIADAVLSQLSRTDDEEHVVRSLSTKYSPDDLSAALQEIRELRRRGLFLPDSNDPRLLKSYPVTSLTLNVSHACNLRCSYCFAGQGPYGSEPAIMDKATAQRAIDLLMTLSGKQTDCTIVFFGGEPLLNVPVIKDTIAYARDRIPRHGNTVTFSMTTNGLLLSDELIEYFIENEVNILISMDGPKDVQDVQRPLAGRSGSYDSLLPRVKALAHRLKGRVSARATITRQNVEISRVVEHLSSIGFSRVYCMPVSSTCPGDPLTLTRIDVKRIEAEYEQMAGKLLNAIRRKESYSFGGFRHYLSLIHLAQRRMYACGVGRSMITVTPSGDIYPCHRFVGMEAFRMSNIWDEPDVTIAQKKFIEASVSSLPGCRKCWARYLCSGHCLNVHARADGSFGGPNPLHCRLWKKTIELSLFLYAGIKEEFPEAFDQLSHAARQSHGA